MRRSKTRPWHRLLLLPALLLAGCASPGSPFSLTPPGQRLTPEARALRQAVPDPQPLPRELDKRLHPPYVVEPGDVLLVQPVKFDSPIRLPGDQTVLPDGTIDLGQYGRPVVAGKTLPEIEQLVQTFVEAKEKDAGPINVRIISRQSKVFYVLGEVNAPGAYQLTGRETVLDALVIAGGVTQQASLSNVTLSRPTPPDGCRIVLPVCYEEIVQIGDTSTNYQVAAGDRIFVPAKGFWESFCPYQRSVCPPCGRPQVPCGPLDPYFIGINCSAYRAAPTPPPPVQTLPPEAAPRLAPLQ